MAAVAEVAACVYVCVGGGVRKGPPYLSSRPPPPPPPAMTHTCTAAQIASLRCWRSSVMPAWVRIPTYASAEGTCQREERRGGVGGGNSTAVCCRTSVMPAWVRRRDPFPPPSSHQRAPAKPPSLPFPHPLNRQCTCISGPRRILSSCRVAPFDINPILHTRHPSPPPVNSVPASPAGAHCAAAS